MDLVGNLDISKESIQDVLGFSLVISTRSRRLQFVWQQSCWGGWRDSVEHWQWTEMHNNWRKQLDMSWWPEKNSTSHWMHQKKSRRSNSKIMIKLTVYFYSYGVVHKKFLHTCQTVKTKIYCHHYFIKIKWSPLCKKRIRRIWVRVTFLEWNNVFMDIVLSQ